MIDLSGHKVTIVLNPAQGATYNPNTGVLTFADFAGSVQNVIVGKLIQHADKTWATCFPKACDT